MEKRTFHGPVEPDDFARALIAEFNQGNLRARQIGRGDHRVVQIASRDFVPSGGRTAITVQLSRMEDGVHIQIGQQDWFGVAASLSLTALAALSRPASILSRIDDLAQDLASLQLTSRIWQTLAQTADTLGASHELSERLRRLACEYCLTANPIGMPNCVSCGAPMGLAQPTTCRECGYVIDASDTTCPQCGAKIPH